MNPLEFLRPGIRDLMPYTADQGSARIKMDANESPFEPVEAVVEELSFLYRCIHLNRYPDPSAGTLKKRIAETLSVEPDRLMLGNGSDELITYLITAFPGRNRGILVPVPTFSMYAILARTQGQPVIEVPMDPDFAVDADILLGEIRKGSPQLIFLATPNNPTGTRIPEDTVLRVLRESRAIVVLDEAYVDYSDHAGYLKYLDTHPNLVILRTLSKIGMAALRVGVLAASREILRELEKVRLPYNINTLSQTAASVLLSHPEILEQQIRTIVTERERLFAALSEIPGIRAFPSQANFLLFRVPEAGALHRYLLEGGILIRNLDSPGPLAGCLRVTVGKPEENQEFLERLRNFFERRR